MTRLVAGQSAPIFNATLASGEPFCLESLRSRRVWLCLMRYAACPFCNWRVHRLIGEYASIANAGLELVTVFPSPISRCQAYIERYQPSFPVVTDPDDAIHDLYATETSWVGELRTAVQVVKVARVVAAHPNNPLAVDGPIHRMPAEFLIEVGGTIAMAHYGKSIDDGIDIDAAIAWGRGGPLPKTA